MEHELEIKFEWENNVGFRVTSKYHAEDAILIIEAEENGHIASLWKNYSDAIKKFIEIRLAKIGQEMAQE